MKTTTEYPPLTAYRAFYADGRNYVTSMAAGVTLADARAYFVGNQFEQPDGSLKTVVRVDRAEPLSAT